MVMSSSGIPDHRNGPCFVNRKYVGKYAAICKYCCKLFHVQCSKCEYCCKSFQVQCSLPNDNYVDPTVSLNPSKTILYCIKYAYNIIPYTLSEDSEIHKSVSSKIC